MPPVLCPPTSSVHLPPLVANSLILHNFDFILFPILPPFSDSGLNTSGFIPRPPCPPTSNFQQLNFALDWIWLQCRFKHYIYFIAMKTISAAEANRQFSTVLREVSQGEEFTVLSRGRAVAAIVPIRKSGSDHKTAKQSLLVRLRKQSITGSREWNRAELYND